MKKLIIIIIAVFVTNITTAQITLALSVNARPMSNLSMWSTRADMLTLVATVQSAADRINCKINTTITEVGGSVIASTNLQAAPIISLRSGNNVLYAKDVLDFNALVFSEKINAQMSKSGQLPAGTYQISVRFVEVAQPITISTIQEKIFTIAPVVLPILIKPYAEEVLNKIVAQSSITFRWSPLVPSEDVSYRLMVFEVLSDQTPTQAIRANMPLLDKTIRKLTQFVWNSQLQFTDSINNQLVWTVQSLDSQGNPVLGENPGGQGISEPVLFYIGEKAATEAKKEEEN